MLIFVRYFLNYAIIIAKFNLFVNVLIARTLDISHSFSLCLLSVNYWLYIQGVFANIIIISHRASLSIVVFYWVK